MPNSNLPIEYLAVVNEKKVWTGIMAIRKPPNTHSSSFIKQYNHRLIGICSNKDFPKTKHAIIDSAAGWCHCFRNPYDIFPTKTNLALISESDFAIPQYSFRNTNKIYDFVYVCYETQKETKNYELFQKCIETLCDKMNLKGVVVGMCQRNNIFHSSLSYVGKVSQKRLFQYMSQSRFLFVPNIKDASPKAITESFCVNTPVIVNRNIYGGWKYVNEETGEFFSSETDIGDAVDNLLSNYKRYDQCREWFCSQYGPENSGKRLKEFLRGFTRINISSNYLVFDKNVNLRSNRRRSMNQNNLATINKRKV